MHILSFLNALDVLGDPGALHRPLRATHASFACFALSISILVLCWTSCRRAPSQERANHLAVDVRLAARWVARGGLFCGEIVRSFEIVWSRNAGASPRHFLVVRARILSCLRELGSLGLFFSIFALTLFVTRVPRNLVVPGLQGSAEVRLAGRVLRRALCALHLLLVNLTFKVENLIAEGGNRLLRLCLCLLGLLRAELFLESGVLFGLLLEFLLRLL